VIVILSGSGTLTIEGETTAFGPDSTLVIPSDAVHQIVNTARVLKERKIGCLPVDKDGHLVGILTEGDFVALVARGG